MKLRYALSILLVMSLAAIALSIPPRILMAAIIIGVAILVIIVIIANAADDRKRFRDWRDKHPKP